MVGSNNGGKQTARNARRAFVGVVPASRCQRSDKSWRYGRDGRGASIGQLEIGTINYGGFERSVAVASTGVGARRSGGCFALFKCCDFAFFFLGCCGAAQAAAHDGAAVWRRMTRWGDQLSGATGNMTRRMAHRPKQRLPAA